MPNKDYEALNIHRGVSIEALLKGDVDAIAVGSSHLVNIRDKFPDAGLRVAARGPDLPNDVLVAGAHVPAEQVEEIRAAFVNNAKQLMDAALKGEENKKYSGGQFIPTVEDVIDMTVGDGLDGRRTAIDREILNFGAGNLFQHSDKIAVLGLQGF